MKELQLYSQLTKTTVHSKIIYASNIKQKRKSEQAHIPHAPTLLEKAVYNEWQFQALGTGNRTKKGI